MKTKYWVAILTPTITTIVSVGITAYMSITIANNNAELRIKELEKQFAQEITIRNLEKKRDALAGLLNIIDYSTVDLNEELYRLSKTGAFPTKDYEKYYRDMEDARKIQDDSIIKATEEKFRFYVFSYRLHRYIGDHLAWMPLELFGLSKITMLSKFDSMTPTAVAFYKQIGISAKEEFDKLSVMPSLPETILK